MTRIIDPSRLDRLPPHSLEAEQGALGCCLLSPNESIGACVEKLKGDAEAFYDLRHRSLFETLVAMWDGKHPIDLVTVPQRLRDGGILDGVGGFTYLSQLLEATPSAANLDYYLEILTEKHVARKLISTCTAIIGKSWDYSGGIASLVDEAERDFLSVGSILDNSGSELTQKDHVRSAIDAIQRQDSGGLTGLTFGFDQLDRITGGAQDSEMIVIGARPSCGKTSLAFQTVVANAEKGIPVGVFSLEMTAPALNKRAIGTISRVNVQQRGGWNESQYKLMSAAGSKLAKMPIFIDDRSGLPMSQIKARARRWVKKHKIRLIVIDYLTLIQPRSSRSDNRQAAVAEISTEIKGLAKELKIPVIVLAQLSRDIEKGKERRPMLSDLRESGQIEQDADLVCFLYKEEPDHDPSDNLIKVNLLIAKQRNGSLGDIRLMFNKEITRFEEVSPIA